MLVQSLGPFVMTLQCVECGKRVSQETRDPMLDGVVEPVRCKQCVAEHEGARDE